MIALSVALSVAALAALMSVGCVAQPPGGAPGGGTGMHMQTNGSVPAFTHGTGSSTSTACPSVSSPCPSDGSGNYFDSSGLTWSNGRFTGTLVTNICPHYAYGSKGNPSPTCTSQTIPDPAFATGAHGAPLLGTVGYSWDVTTNKGGMVIYGPLEAGFTANQACTVNAGVCPAGMDVPTCEAKLDYECGTSNVITGMLPDSCGAHASPYHFHHSMTCVDHSTSGHSNLVGVALDGYGIYGVRESTSATPTDLDACGGHIGLAPKTDGTVPTTPFYHYHIQDIGPFTLGCYGNGATQTLAQCKALYSECSSTAQTYTTSQGSIQFTLWCPCWSASQAPLLKGGMGATVASAPSGSSATPAASSPIKSGPSSPTGTNTTPASTPSACAAPAVAAALLGAVLAAAFA